MNLIAINGRLTRDPELRTGRTAAARFSVAVDFFKNGEKTADFFDCVAFGKTAETVEKYFHKGDGIGLKGEMHQERYEKDGKNRSAWVLYVDKVYFGAKVENVQKTPENAAKNVHHETPEDDDFPF